MFERMSEREFKDGTGEGLRCPVYAVYPGDMLTPVAAYRKLVPPGAEGFLLESAEHTGEVGRYSFLGFSPGIVFESRGRNVTVRRGGEVRSTVEDPIAALKRVQAQSRSARLPAVPALVGGAIGFAAYDAIRLVEKLPSVLPGPQGVPDLRFAYYDTVVIFDHLTHKMIVTQMASGGSNGDFREAQERLEALKAVLFSSAVHPEPPPEAPPPPGAPDGDQSDADYGRRVLAAKEHIAAGDIFQVVLSRSFEVPLTVPPFTFYRALRMVNPSPYMFYIETGDVCLLGSSPERLVRVLGGMVETLPIAGTRPRGVDEEDLRLERELLADPKERAEHMMLVDLARNDVGRVARPGSVKVSNLASVERFSHVMHLTSTVRGDLAPGLHGLDALFSCLPAGTLSGAPKIRAMEIIEELETSRRGIYGGAVGYLGAEGDLDTCIAIRMATIVKGRALIRAGAGIVWDSVPEREAEETRAKAACLFRALEVAREVLP